MLFALQKYGFKWIFPNYVVILWPQEETPLFVENIIMLMHRLYIACLMGLLTLGLLASCKGKKEKMLTPWGEEVGGDDSVSTQKAFTLSDIQNNGELIMLTMSGPETYYDYHGRGMGLQYLLAEKFAQSLGVSLRVEVCRDTLEMVRKLKSGDGDLVAFPLPQTYKGIRYCGVKIDSLHAQWAVQENNVELADSLTHWYRPSMIVSLKKEENFLLSARSVTRHIYSPMLNRARGQISQWDSYFQQYAPMAGWDWRLMAAQCYQESTFDPRAHSWAGACGLMQIMPRTADHLGIAREDIYDPELNIAAAAKYIRQLSGHFADVPNPAERSCYVLAGYNGGSFHIRDAMALARKYGRNPYSWNEVQEFVLRLSTPAYYNDPVVKHGYMRGQETVNYVNRILDRWAQYRGVVRSKNNGFPSDHFKGFGGGFDNMSPSRAKHHNRFKI